MECLNHQETSENISTVLFGFLTHKWRWRNRCTSCSNAHYSQDNSVNVLYVNIRQTEDAYYTYDMKEAVMTTLGQENYLPITCPEGGNQRAQQKMELVETRKFLVIKMLIFNQNQKTTAMCNPLQNLELNVNNVHSRYQLECII